MNLAGLLQQYGYLAVLIGTFFEGETLLLLGGVAAQQGHLRLPLVFLLAIIGSFSGDQVAYFVGRRFGPRLVEKRVAWRERVARVRRILERHRYPILIGFRFVYGIRIAGPVAFGMSGVRPGTFAPLNALGAVLWSLTIAGLGYLFGAAVTRVLERVQRYQGYVLVAALGVAFTVIGVVHLVRWRRRRRAPSVEVEDPAGPPAPAP